MRGKSDEFGSLTLCSLESLQELDRTRYEDLAHSFKELEATVDSGAARCAFPRTMFSTYMDYEVSDTKCRTATGNIVNSDGKVKVGVYVQDGTYHEISDEVKDIHKCFLSVLVLMDAEHDDRF